MSRNTDPTGGCKGKARYRKFERAERAATRAAKSSEEPMHAYKCVQCNRFHFGAHVKRRKPATPAPVIEGEE